MTPSSSTLCFLVLLTVLIRTHPCYAQICYNTVGNFTSNSTYAKNRDAVLRSLPSNMAAHDGFYATSMGENPNSCYAIAYCRGDTSADICAALVRSAIEDLIMKCPNQKAAFSWGTGDPPCFIRYSDSPIYGVLQMDPTISVKNGQSITIKQDQFNEIWRNLTQTLASQAGEGSSNLKFAKGKADLPDNKTIYSMLQCSPDISPSDCGSCLYKSIDDYDKCCRRSKGGLIYKPSCFFRWELFRFWGLSSSPPSSSPPPHGGNVIKGNISKSLWIVEAVEGSGVIVMVIVFMHRFIIRRRASPRKVLPVKEEVATAESLQFKLNEIRAATNFFSEGNRLGEGGFGKVYQGKLENGNIAVKRLERYSNQGQQHFKNEVNLLARLQHKNLIKLYGYCLEERERILILEFAPNGSLERFISDSIRRGLLSWEKRFGIIKGIARGLLYLHEDSGLMIIHRDLKPNNILLDDNMNPKISDFGTARLFVLEQSRDKTAHIEGTSGYMAPEYIRHGEISVKTDVYSFGVVVLEIICGRKSSFFSSSGYSEHLLGYAWKNWRKGMPFRLVDPMLNDSLRSELIRCIHIALLCVQEDVARRPTMGSVVLMLGSQSTTLPMLTRPAYLTDASVREMSTSSVDGSSTPSTNEAQDGSTVCCDFNPYAVTQDLHV